jgi:hypothetical protein
MELILIVVGFVFIISCVGLYLYLVDQEKIEPMLPPRYMNHGGIEVKYSKEDYEKHDTIQQGSRRTKKNS